MTAIAGTLISAVGLVGYLSFRNGQKAVSDLAYQLRREITARIEQELQGYFATPHEINRLNADAFARGNLDVIGGTRGESQLYQQMVVDPTVAFVYCGSASGGEFFGVLRSPNDGSLQLSYGNQSNSYLRDFYSLDVAGDRAFQLNQAERPFDARQRPWYQGAVAAQRPIWTDVYVAFTTGLPNITAALPVYDRSGRRLLGVCATDVVLPEEFRAFLQTLEIGQNGQAFVMDRAGNLISNSTDEPLMLGDEETAELLPATQSQNQLVRQTVEYLNTQFDDFDEITQAQQLEFKLRGERQFLQVVPFRDQFGLDWLIAVVVPESDFMAQINANTRNTILLCLGTAVLATLLSIFAARWITRPILRISQASNELTDGDMNQHIPPSSVTEINTLASSFNQMTERLQTSFEALSNSEARNRALLNAIPDLMLEISAAGIYLDFLEAKGDKWLPVNKANQIGKSVDQVLPPTIAQQYHQAIQTVLQTGEPQTLEYQLLIESELQTFEARVVPCKAESALFIVRNITSRKRAEEALKIAEENYRSIFENALEGIFQSSPDGKFLNVNPALAKIYGYDSPAEMMQDIDSIADQLYVDPEKRIEFKELLEKQERVKQFEYQCYCKDGRVIWTQIDARVVKDGSNNVVSYEGIVQDVTERKRREAELRQQLEDLQIEIDQNKRDEEVATLTASSYFQEVQQELSEVNLDEFWS